MRYYLTKNWCKYKSTCNLCTLINVKKGLKEKSMLKINAHINTKIVKIDKIDKKCFPKRMKGCQNVLKIELIDDQIH